MEVKRLTVAHIVNPVRVGTQSDLFVAQPITFESMRVAREVAQPVCDIELYSAQYLEDRGLAPDFFSETPDLDRSVMDLQPFQTPKKLPLLRDILNRLYNASKADYFIYTNVDIALKPAFYVSVCRLINDGIDGMVINRRTISNRYSSIADLPRMYDEAGEPHYGYDCFVFRRDVYQRFDLGNVCIGAGSVGAALLLNIACFATEFREFIDLHLTFHLGNSEVWRLPELSGYQEFNGREYVGVLNRLASKFNVNRLPALRNPFHQEYLKHIREGRTVVYAPKS